MPFLHTHIMSITDAQRQMPPSLPNAIKNNDRAAITLAHTMTKERVKENAVKINMTAPKSTHTHTRSRALTRTRTTTHTHLLLTTHTSSNTRVQTVDGFQGREKECIVFSAVRCNPERKVGFLSDERRLNVAITRAKRGLVIVGDEQTLSASPVWRDYLRFLRKKGCGVEAVDALVQ